MANTADSGLTNSAQPARTEEDAWEALGVDDCDTQQEQQRSRTARVGLTVAGTMLTATMALTLPFLRRFSGAPYVASSTAARTAILQAVQRHVGDTTTARRHIVASATCPSRNSATSASADRTHTHASPSVSGSPSVTSQRARKVIDLGSGSGDVVLTLADNGIHATGYDLNPWLVLLSRYRALSSAKRRTYARFVWGDMWTAPLRDADAVVVFGVPSIMRRIGDKMAHDAQQGCLLCSNTFKVPGWRNVAHAGGVWFYRIGESDDDAYS